MRYIDKLISDHDNCLDLLVENRCPVDCGYNVPDYWVCCDNPSNCSLCWLQEFDSDLNSDGRFIL